jgi:hypothetical protein
MAVKKMFLKLEKNMFQCWHNNCRIVDLGVINASEKLLQRIEHEVDIITLD